MKRYINITFALTMVLLTACKNDCRVVRETYDNGQEQVVEYYPDCNDTSTYKRQTFYENGQPSSEGFIIKGVENGNFKSWTEEGILTAEWEMIEGKEHGFIQCWHDNGVKKREVMLNKGIRDGIYKDWDENGQPIVEGNYENEKKEGKWTFWDENGTWKIKTYKNDTLWGYTYDYLVDTSGVTQVVGQYEKGLKTGLWNWFNKDSVLTQTAYYLDGILQGEFTQYYIDGQIMRVNVYQNDTLALMKAYFDKNGSQILDNGTGYIYTYFDNGNIKYIGQFLNSKRSGLCKWYYENGQLEQEAFYKNNLRMEVVSSFDKNGNRREAGTLKNGNGTWIKYDDFENIKEVKTYKKGILVE